MRWVQADTGDYRGTPPSPRSGHSSVRVGGSLLVVFGGLVDKTFLQDLAVLDIDTQIWCKPTTTVGGSDVVGPGPRAFHVAVASHGHMFVFGGRSGRKRLGDFWVLDTDTWQWSQLVGYGDLPPARDFAAGASYGDGKLVIYGGWDGSKWLSDVFVLDTISLEWRQLSVVGPTPAPRCGHSLIMVEKRMLIFGGRGGGGPIMGDLWALKGLFGDEGEPAAWTQLRLPGSAPSPRCGHSITSGGSQLFVFGGHGTGGWLTRYDIYYNDVINLDRDSVHWKRLTVFGEPPPPRAYHSMTQVHGRYLLFGGYDGKLTHGDIWWLVSEDDPIGSRALLTHQHEPEAPIDSARRQKVHEDGKVGSVTANFEMTSSVALAPIHELRQRLGLSPYTQILPTAHRFQDGLAIRELLSKSHPRVTLLRDAESLLKNYQSMVSFLDKRKGEAYVDYRSYHLTDVKKARLDDIAQVLDQYNELQLTSEVFSSETGTRACGMTKL